MVIGDEMLMIFASRWGLLRKAGALRTGGRGYRRAANGRYISYCMLNVL